jgi:FtsP/CotA-like multicopper oxidase with cupredoxin domain
MTVCVPWNPAIRQPFTDINSEEPCEYPLMQKNKVLVAALAAVIAVVTQGSARPGRFSGRVSTPAAIAPVANACSRLAAGSAVANPPSLFSRKGVLSVGFSYQTTTDEDGRSLFCFMTRDGLENPTLHVHPGDHLIITTTNNTPAAPVEMQINSPNCGASAMTSSSVNLHYHGTNTSPTCHQDDVIHTIINSGQTLAYDVHIPFDEPPGLYWYHPHIHGHLEAALQGGGSGAIVVEGIQSLQPLVAGLRQRILVVRDQNVAGNPTPGGSIPSWDLTLNNIPIAYPDEIPAVIKMEDGERQLWRVANASADTILDLQVQYDGIPQTLEIVGLDGVPTGSQDGARRGRILMAKHILVPTAGRAEFILKAPSGAVRNASLVTLAIDTGPGGDNDPQRTLASIETAAEPGQSAIEGDSRVPATLGPIWKQRFEKLATASVSTQRALYFSEVLSDPKNPLSPTNFFVTVDGASPELFDPNNPPAIVTAQGSVEDWTIENRTQENHEFHIHQIHFLVLAQNNFEPNGSQPDASVVGQYLDTIQVPYWDGDPNHPFPSVTVRMDFRGADIGDFVYHCHIAGHEDNGMMAIIRVMPSAASAAIEKIRIYLTSLGLFGEPVATESPKNLLWCVRGSIARTPVFISDAHFDNAFITQRAPLSKSVY